VSKKNNGTFKKVAAIISIIIGVSLILSTIGAGGVSLFKSKIAYECSQENKEEITDLKIDQKVLLVELKNIAKGVENIQEEQKEIKRDIKRLGR